MCQHRSSSTSSRPRPSTCQQRSLRRTSPSRRSTSPSRRCRPRRLSTMAARRRRSSSRPSTRTPGWSTPCTRPSLSAKWWRTTPCMHCSCRGRPSPRKCPRCRCCTSTVHRRSTALRPCQPRRLCTPAARRRCSSSRPCTRTLCWTTPSTRSSATASRCTSSRCCSCWRRPSPRSCPKYRPRKTSLSRRSTSPSRRCRPSTAYRSAARLRHSSSRPSTRTHGWSSPSTRPTASARWRCTTSR